MPSVYASRKSATCNGTLAADQEAGEAFLFGETLRSRRDLELVDRGPAQAGTPAANELRGRIRQLQRVLEAESAKPATERRELALEMFMGELAAAERE